MGELFKPGAPLGRDVKHLLPLAPMSTLFAPRFRLQCVKCGRIFEDITEAYQHQRECPEACFRIILG